jgi:hypothetical protein
MKTCNAPKRIPAEAYDAETAQYLRRTMSVRGVLAIFQYGRKDAPGISDLDIMVVLGEEFARENASDLAVRNGGTCGRIWLHQPLILPRYLLGELHHLVFVTNLKVLWCKPGVELPVSTPVVSADLALAHIIGFLALRLREFADVQLEQRIDKRLWLTRLGSFVHTGYLCAVAGLDLPARCRQVMARLQKIREKWKRGKRCADREFIQVFKNCEEAQSFLFERAVRLAAQRITSLPVRFLQMRHFCQNRSVFCAESVERSRSVARDMRFAGKRRRYYVTYAPIEYARQIGLIRACMARSSWQGGTSYEIAMRRRISAVQRHLDYLQANDLSFCSSGKLGLPVVSDHLKHRVLDPLHWACAIAGKQL